MVFSSIPAYLDPTNWQQLPNHQALASNTHSISTQLLPPPSPPPQPHGNGGGMGSIRPGSMADRARQANIPMPEAALKCPRCESTNTKFCYFNNYSLTQPRHFCKTCKRYWTRGGALRNVPMGGGCRRNKRSKVNNSSKSLATGDQQTVAPLHQLDEFTTPSPRLGASEVSGSSGSGGYLVGVQVGQDLPFFSGLDSCNYSSNSCAGRCTFEGGVDPCSYVGGLIRPKILSSGAIQMSSVKMEESQEINLSRQILGIYNHRNDQHWSTGSGWSDVSSFSSSSTGNPL